MGNAAWLGNELMNLMHETSDQNCTNEEAFAFGRNWARFLERLNEDRIQIAEDSLKKLLQRNCIKGCRFLDSGSGSGLFSLAAYRLGTAVTSFDVDADSVACTQELKRRYAREADDWRILRGSLLDQEFLKTLGDFDFVYCWGVAHHSGNMWMAIENLLSLLKPGGTLVLAIYNDQLYISRAWRAVKRIYQRLPVFVRPFFVLAIGFSLFAKRLAVTILACLLRLFTLRNPFVPLMNWAGESKTRGMHGWYDLVDWVGGWPFEVARPEDVFRFVRDRGFILKEMSTSVGHGCNEFAFTRDSNSMG